MVLITQPHVLPLNGFTQYDSIVLLASAEEPIPTETTKALLEYGGEIYVTILHKQASDIKLAFSLGVLVGEFGGENNVSISLENAVVKEMLKELGLKKCLLAQHKNASGRKRTVPSATSAKSERIKKTPAVPASFTTALRAQGIDPLLAEKVAAALRESAESTSYKLRLQLHLVNRALSTDVYAKTWYHYQELKNLLLAGTAEQGRRT